MTEDGNLELYKAWCPICGAQRHMDPKEECGECHARNFGWFKWYLLKNEIQTIKVCLFLLLFALLLFGALYAIPYFWEKSLEETISANMTALIKLEGLW